MELTPRTGPDSAPPAARSRRSPWAYGVLGLVTIGLAVVVWQALTSDALYFYNTDEAVELRDELEDRRFRLHGIPVPGLITTTDEGVDFTVTYACVDVLVRHQGDPPELFEPGVPVVLEGRWSATAAHFDSDRMLVRHSEEYEADHEDRLQEAADLAAALYEGCEPDQQ